MTLYEGKMITLLFCFVFFCFFHLNSQYHLISYHGRSYPSVASARQPGALLTGDQNLFIYLSAHPGIGIFK